MRGLEGTKGTGVHRSDGGCRLQCERRVDGRHATATARGGDRVRRLRSIGWWCRVRTGPAVFLAASLLVASAASGHWDPVQIPPAGDYLIRWYQPHGAVPVQDWEIEVTPQNRPWTRFTADARVVPDSSCWALEVPVAETANVRIRAVVGDQVSAWSRYTVVPEPGLSLGVVTATGALAGLARRRCRRSRSGSGKA